MTMLSRAAGDMEANVFCTDAELAVLRAYSCACNLIAPVDLAAAIVLVAMMGGYMNRKSDLPPGPAVLWRGS